MLDFRYFIFISSFILQFLISTIFHHIPLHLYSYNYYLTSIIYISYLFFFNKANYAIDRSIVLIEKSKEDYYLLNNSTLYLRNFFYPMSDEKGDKNRLCTSLLSLPTLCSTALFRGHASSHLYSTWTNRAFAATFTR